MDTVEANVGASTTSARACSPLEPLQFGVRRHFSHVSMEKDAVFPFSQRMMDKYMQLQAITLGGPQGFWEDKWSLV